MNFKENVYEQARHVLEVKLCSLRSSLQELAESAANETKSTAGDKHETALAMLQIEQENIRRRVAEAEEQLRQLQRIDIQRSVPNAVIGSLIKTNNGYFFISLGLGKISVDGQVVILISPQSPLGQKLITSQCGDRIDMNGTIYEIESIT